MGQKRDSKGRFVKGSVNKNAPFRTMQPKNRGRKPSRFKQIIAEMEGLGAEALSREDYENIVTFLLSLTGDELIKVAQDKKTPIAVVVIANALSGDIENKNMGNIDRMLDRIFGRAVVKQEVTGKDGKDLMPEPIKIEIIDKREDVKDANDSDNTDI